LSFNRRSFIASAFVGVDALRPRLNLFDLMRTNTKEEGMSDISNIPLTSHYHMEADGVRFF